MSSLRRRKAVPLQQWPLDAGITVVLFAGLGGACAGLEEAGCPVHIANNHDHWQKEFHMSSDMVEMFRDMDAHRAEQRKINLAAAVAADDGGWMKHSPYHWSRWVGGLKLQYWPSAKKWQYAGKMAYGDPVSLAGFIAKRSTKEAST